MKVTLEQIKIAERRLPSYMAQWKQGERPYFSRQGWYALRAYEIDGDW